VLADPIDNARRKVVVASTVTSRITSPGHIPTPAQLTAALKPQEQRAHDRCGDRAAGRLSECSLSARGGQQDILIFSCWMIWNKNLMIIGNSG
jgi:hypothetical protein